MPSHDAPLTFEMKTLATCPNPFCGCEACACGASCVCGLVAIGEVERRVMDVMWGNGGREMTIREVADSFPEHAYTTIATMLNRLVDKGLIVRSSEEDRRVRFAARGTDDAYVALLMHKLLVTADDPDLVLTRFMDSLSDDEMRAMRQQLGGRNPRRR